VVSFHHAIACSDIADGRGDIQIWGVAKKTLNNQSQIAHKGRFQTEETASRYGEVASNIPNN
jgi:hypothetical protein